MGSLSSMQKLHQFFNFYTWKFKIINLINFDFCKLLCRLCQIDNQITKDYLMERNKSHQYILGPHDSLLYFFDIQWYILYQCICCLVHNHYLFCNWEEYIFFWHKTHLLDNLDCFCIVEYICHSHNLHPSSVDRFSESFDYKAEL